MFHVEQRKKRNSRLVDNISSEMLSAASEMQRRERILVYVEGYDDIAFWRQIFDDWESEGRKFEITTPMRSDMAKGKKVVLSFADRAGKNLLLCVDSDFDYLFGEANYQSKAVNQNPFLIQTYTYAIENLQCYPPSLSSITIRATKNDNKIFDFEKFMQAYSVTIYPLFLWYVYAAFANVPEVFSLSDFRNSVRVNYLEIEFDGEKTIEWLERQTTKRLKQLQQKYAAQVADVKKVEAMIRARGVTPERTHIYMQGHCLLDNVVKVVVASVCDALRKEKLEQITASKLGGLTLRNEMNSYNNSLRDIDTLLADNIGYKQSAEYRMIRERIDEVVLR